MLLLSGPLELWGKPKSTKGSCAATAAADDDDDKKDDFDDDDDDYDNNNNRQVRHFRFHPSFYK